MSHPNARLNISRLKTRQREPVVRYEWPNPGDMVHLDIKKLGRIKQGGGHRAFGRGPSMHQVGMGWDYVHVVIDDYSLLAFAEIWPDETGEGVTAFTRNALEFFAGHGIEVRRILTDNGAGYRSHAFRDLLADCGISMRKTRPYRPQTNGNAGAFVKISTNERAYGDTYLSNEERAERLGPFLREYNLFRPHGGLGG